MAHNSHINRGSKIKGGKRKRRQDLSNDSYSDDDSSDLYDYDTIVDTVFTTSSVNANQSTSSSCISSHTESWHSLDEIVDDDRGIIEIAAMQLTSNASFAQQRLPQKLEQQRQQQTALSSSSNTATSRQSAYTTSSCTSSYTESWHSFNDIDDDDMEIIEAAATQLASIASLVQQRLHQKPEQHRQQQTAVSSSSSSKPVISRKRAYKSKSQQRKELGEKIFVYHGKGYYPANVVILEQDDTANGVCNSSGMLMKIDDDTGEALVYIQWESCRTREFVSINSIDWISREANTEHLDLNMNLKIALDHTKIVTNESGSIQSQDETALHNTTKLSQTIASAVSAFVAPTTTTKTKPAPTKTITKRKTPKSIRREYTSIGNHDDNNGEGRATYRTPSKSVSLKRRCKFVVKYDYDTDDSDVFFENFVH